MRLYNNRKQRQGKLYLNGTGKNDEENNLQAK